MSFNKIYPTIFFFFIFSSSLFAQKYTVKGTVIDTTQMPLPSATVVILNQSDSVLTNFSITNDDGYFEVPKVAEGEYILQVTYLGYDPFSQPFSLSENSGDFDAETIQMSVADANLEEVVVKAEHIPIQIKGDTIQYNADAFQVQPGSAVEDLLKKLPGVEVDREGNVRAQGEDVQNVLVDGKEFFGNDPKIATKNLPADAVDNVKVYDKKSDMAEFSGIDDGEREKTINLELKDGKKKGYFGTAEGGYGTDDRYKGKFNLNRFSKKMQFSAIGMLNNINEQGFSINEYMNFMGGLQNMMSGGGGRIELSFDSDDMGIPLNFGQANGIRTTTAGGVNMNYEFSEKTELNGSYFYNQIKNEIGRDVSRQNLAEFGAFNSTENTDQIGQNKSHRINLTLNHEIDSFQNIRLRANGGFNDADLSNIGLTQTFNAENILENSGYRDYQSIGENWNLTSNLLYRRRFHKKGRVFTASIDFGKRDNEQNANLNSINSFPLENLVDSVMQRQFQTNDETNYSGRISYTESLGGGKYLGINYSRSNYKNDLIKDFFDILNPATRQEIFNETLSNKYKRDYTYDRGGLTFQLNKKKFNFSTGVSVQHSRLDGELQGITDPIRNDFTNILPSLRWNYDFKSTRNLTFRYETSVREPSLEQLQPIPDNSDPLNIYIGNPELRPEYTHRVDLHFMDYNQFNFTSIFGNLNINYATNKITNKRTIDQSFRQTIQPINVENDLLVNGYFGFGTPLRFIKSRIDISGNLFYNRGILFVNDIENTTERFESGVEVTLENRKKETFDVAIGVAYNFSQTQYSESTAQNQDYLNRTFFTEMTLNLGKKWALSSFFDYSIYSGESFGSEQTIPLWEASLTRYFLKNRKGRLILSAFDLLNRNIGINRTSNLNYIEEARVQALGRYFLLTFAYSISGFGNNGDSGGVHIQTSRRR
jgi:hypothetical protein